MGTFTGKQNPPGLGGKGFFGPPAVVAVKPSGFVIQAGNGGAPGFSMVIKGWAGVTGSSGAGFTGSVISGSADVFANGTDLAFGDCVGGSPPGEAPPFFFVSSDAVFAKNFFTRVTINGHTYLTAAADFFSNGGGCGPTIWEWLAPAGIVAGTQYPTVFA